MSKSTLKKIMQEDIPSIAAQRKYFHRTNIPEIKKLFKIINKEVFNNQLPTPKFKLLHATRQYWGECESYNPVNKKTSNCVIIINNKWYCKQWLIMILAHEMCHQYQWDIVGLKRLRQNKKPILSHGPSFFIFKDKLAKYGIPLRRSHSTGQWFKHQDLFKC